MKLIVPWGVLSHAAWFFQLSVAVPPILADEFGSEKYLFATPSKHAAFKKLNS
jgi:hypothetical protein